MLYRVLYTVHLLQRVERDVQPVLNTIIVVLRGVAVVQGTVPHLLQGVERDVD